MSEIRWEEPPTRRAGRMGDKYSEVAEALRANPNKWAVVQTFPLGRQAGSLAFNIRSGLVKAFRPVGAFEATARKNGDETSVYARYVGGAS